MVPPAVTLDCLARADHTPENVHALARLVIPAGLAAFIVLFAGAATAQMKVAIVDVERAVAQTEAGIRATATLKKEFEPRQEKLNRRQGELQKQKDEIDQQAGTLPQEALRKKAEEWQRQMVDLQKKMLEAQKDLEKRQRSLMDPIYEKVSLAMKRIAGIDGFDLVVDRHAVLFVRADLDVTDRVIQLANAAAASSSAPAPVRR
jgi:outer membrane protein